MDVTLNVFVLMGIVVFFTVAGFLLMGALALSGRASLEEEQKLKKCQNCGHFMLKKSLE